MRLFLHTGVGGACSVDAVMRRLRNRGSLLSWIYLLFTVNIGVRGSLVKSLVITSLSSVNPNYGRVVGHSAG